MPLKAKEFGHKSHDRLQYSTPSERKQSIKLIEVLLDTIAESVSTFKPSKSLAIISRKHDEETRAAEYFDSLPQPDDSGSENDNASLRGSSKGSLSPAVAEIDLVISGGGFKGYFMCGAAHVLTKELAKRNMRINRIGGTSAGAWAGLFICCGFSASHWMETYFACKDRPLGTIHEVYTDLVRSSLRFTSQPA
jgi:Patatin-like phospholipase